VITYLLSVSDHKR